MNHPNNTICEFHHNLEVILVIYMPDIEAKGIMSYLDLEH